MVPERKRDENHGIDMFLLLQSYTFLAPLSDPFFGSEMQETCGIDMLFILQFYTFLAPLSDLIFGAQNAPEPKRKENHGFGLFLLLQSYTFLAPLSDPTSEEIYAMLRDGREG